jgi:hypothetical protein
LVRYVADSTQGFTLMLAGLKALLEHNIRLNLTVRRLPEGDRGAGDRRIAIPATTSANQEPSMMRVKLMSILVNDQNRARRVQSAMVRQRGPECL